MAASWVTWRARGASGIITLDPDVVADPDDIETMRGFIDYDNSCVWASMHKLWPASTHRDTWVWAFGKVNGDRPVMSQSTEGPYGWFALGMTYLPAALLDIAVRDMPLWEFGMIDMGLSRTAREHGFTINVAGNCHPKHVHFTPHSNGNRSEQ